MQLKPGCYADRTGNGKKSKMSGNRDSSLVNDCQSRRKYFEFEVAELVISRFK